MMTWHKSRKNTDTITLFAYKYDIKEVEFEKTIG